MRSVWSVLRTEHPWNIGREAVWRLRKRFASGHSLLAPGTRVRFRWMQYYNPGPGVTDEEEKRPLLDLADNLQAGRVPILGFGFHELGRPSRWHVDFTSSLSWPGDAASDSLRLIRHDGSDIKVPWELSRLQWLPVLGKAFRVSGDARYRKAAQRFLSDWINGNPVGEGVNWAIAMEASLRAISICLLLDLLHPFSPGEEKWVAEAEESLWQHLGFIEAHSEFSYFGTSNHYLSNLVGSYVVAEHLEFDQAAQLRRGLWRKIESEMERQVYSDGGDYEASMGYHLLVTQMFTTAFRVASLAGAAVSSEFCKRLHLMFCFMEKMADAQGRLPHIGDGDDGRVEWTADDITRLGSGRADDALKCPDFIGLGAALFGGISRFRSPAAAWYGLPPTSIAEGPQKGVAAFPGSGIVKATTASSELWYLAVPNGIGGKGSHTHNDKLSILLHIAGREFLVDSGSYVYSKDLVARNRLRSTAAHSTLSIDGLEQNILSTAPDQLFRLGNQARVTPPVVTENGESVIITATHNGYSRVGCTHTRTCCLSGSSLHIIDALSGAGPHSVEMSLIIASGWRCELSGPGQLAASCGSLRVIITLKAPSELSMQVLPWEVSRSYGSLVGATRVAIAGEVLFPSRFETELTWG